MIKRNVFFKRTLGIALLIVLALGAAGQARADGFLVVSGVYRQPESSHINVVIKDKIATTTLEQTFMNPLDKELSATYVAPVPPGATIISFAEFVDGQWYEAKIQAKEEAEEKYATAVAKGEDAALASGSTATPAPNQTPVDPRMTFQIQLFLPPSAERKVRLVYSEVLLGEVGLTRYTYPLSASNLTDESVGDLLVQVDIEEKEEIRAVYSPSHKDTAEVSRPDSTTARLVYRAQDVTPNQDFEVIYTQSADKFGLNLASFRDDGDDGGGYFMLVAAPQLEVNQDEVVEKDFVFVLDVSGSMQGDKATQAKAALNNILDALNEGDRFTVIAFSSGVTPFSTGLRTLDERENAKSWVNAYQIGGGTNINEAMLSALGTVDQSQQRPHIVVFLTDGQATEGVVETRDILANIRGATRPESRIYTIGVGDVNKDLLDAIAVENRGTSLFVDAVGDIVKPLADFYAAIDSPVLVDLALDFGGIEVYDVYPNPLPDMFLGGQVVITGRYRKGGEVAVTLTGNINGEPYSARYEAIRFLDDAETSKPYAFVPRMWAQRKIDALMRKLNLEGTDPKLVEEVRALGLKYNLITPYTSFLALPKEGMPGMGLPILYNTAYRSVNTSFITIGLGLVIVGFVGLFLLRRRG